MPGTGTDVESGLHFQENSISACSPAAFLPSPKCAIELNVRVDAVNGTGVDTFSFSAATRNPAFQHIFSDGLISTPQVAFTVILPASWRQNVGGGDGLMFVTITVKVRCRHCASAKPIAGGSGTSDCMASRFFLNPVKNRPPLRKPFNDSVHHISPVRNALSPETDHRRSRSGETNLK